MPSVPTNQHSVILPSMFYVIQVNAASAVDQFKVAQDRTLALIIYVFIAQLQRVRIATWVTKYSILSLLEIWVLVKT